MMDPWKVLAGEMQLDRLDKKLTVNFPTRWDKWMMERLLIKTEKVDLVIR